MSGIPEELFPLHPYEVEPFEIAKLRRKSADRFHTHRTRIALGVKERLKEMKTPLPFPKKFGVSRQRMYDFKQSTCYNDPHLRTAVRRPEQGFRKAEYINMIRHLQRERYENLHIEMYLKEIQQAMDSRREKAERYKYILGTMAHRLKDNLTEGTHTVGQKGRDLMDLWDQRKPYVDEYKALENELILAKHTLMEQAIGKFVPRAIAMELVYLMTDRKWKEQNDWIHRKDDGNLEEAIESIKNSLNRLRWVDDLLDPKDFETAVYFYLNKPGCSFDIIPLISIVKQKYNDLHEVPSNYFHLSVVAIEWMEFRDSFEKLMKEIKTYVDSANETAVLLTCQRPAHDRRSEFLKEVVTATMDRFEREQLSDKRMPLFGLALLQAARIIYEDKFMQESFIKLHPTDQAVIFTSRIKDLLNNIDSCDPTNVYIAWINTLMDDYLVTQEVNEMVKKWDYLTTMQRYKKKAYDKAMKCTLEKPYKKGQAVKKWVAPQMRKKSEYAQTEVSGHKVVRTPIGELLQRILHVDSKDRKSIVEKVDCPIKVAINAGIKNARRQLM